MTDDLRVLLRNTADEPVGPPDIDDLWRKGSSRRRRRSAARLAVLALPLLFLAAAVSQIGGLSGNQDVETDIAAPNETTSTDVAGNPTVTVVNPTTATDPPNPTTLVRSPSPTEATFIREVATTIPPGPFLAGAAIVALAALSLGQMLRVPWKAALAAIIVGGLVATATTAWYGRGERTAAVELATERAGRNQDTVEALLNKPAPVDGSDREGALESLDIPTGAQPVVRFDSEWLNLRPFEMEWRDIPVTLRTDVQAGRPSSLVSEINGEVRVVVGIPFESTASNSYYEIVSISAQTRKIRALSWALGLTVPFAGLLAALVVKMGDKYADRRRKGPPTDGIIAPGVGI